MIVSSVLFVHLFPHALFPKQRALPIQFYLLLLGQTPLIAGDLILPEIGVGVQQAVQ